MTSATGAEVQALIEAGAEEFVTRRPLPPPSGRGPLGARAVLGSHLRRLWQRWPWDDGGQGPQAGSGYDPVTDFALGDPDSLPARLTAALLSRVGVDGTQVCRRRNYRFLLARVPDAVQWSFPSF
jgi:hypothetical protein